MIATIQVFVLKISIKTYTPKVNWTKLVQC